MGVSCILTQGGRHANATASAVLGRSRFDTAVMAGVALRSAIRDWTPCACRHHGSRAEGGATGSSRRTMGNLRRTVAGDPSHTKLRSREDSLTCALARRGRASLVLGLLVPPATERVCARARGWYGPATSIAPHRRSAELVEALRASPCRSLEDDFSLAALNRRPLDYVCAVLRRILTHSRNEGAGHDL